jgi:hypothetical protein
VRIYETNDVGIGLFGGEWPNVTWETSTEEGQFESKGFVIKMCGDGFLV